MKNIYILTHSVFIIFLFNLTGIAHAECRKDTIIYYNYNGANKETLGRTVNQYNIQNNLIQSTYQNWNTGTLQWEDKTRVDYVYNGNNSVTKVTNSAFSGTWKESNRYVYNYNSNNDLSELIYQIANGSGTFINSTKNSYSYNSDNKIMEKLSFSWNTGSSSWDHESYRTSYTYNANKLLFVELFEQWQSGSNSWLASSKSTSIYDGANNLTFNLSEMWNSGSNKWDSSSNVKYTFNAQNKIIQIINQSWNSGSWKNTGRRSLTYNSNNDLIEINTDKWTGSDWAKNNKNTWDFDANNDNIATDNYYTWTIDKYNLHDRQEFVCTHISGISDNFILQKGITIYPNPANGNEINIRVKTAAEYSLMDFSGKIFSNGKLQAGMNSINITNIQKSGLYFIKTNVGMMKVVIER